MAIWSDVRNALGGAVAQGARRVAARFEKSPAVSIAGVLGLRPPAGVKDEQEARAKVPEPKAMFEDPLSVMAAFGYKDRLSTISYDTMRDVVYRLPVVSNIIQVRVEQVASFGHVADDRYKLGFRIKMREAHQTPTDSEKELCRRYENFMLHTGFPSGHMQRDGFEAYLRKITRDALVFDQNCTEIIHGNNGKPAEFYAIDAANVRLAKSINKHQDVPVPDDIAYVEVWNQIIKARWREKELIFGVRNPSTDIRLNGYGTSELEYLMSTLSQMLNAINYNASTFTNGTMARGILNVRDPDLSNRDLNQIERNWNAMLKGSENAWRTPVIAAKDGVDWINLQGPSEMSYREWIDFQIKVTCFPAGQKVRVADGSQVPIEDIRPGDMVITHMGATKKVKNTQRKSYQGELIRFKAGGLTTLCTPEHPILCRRVSKVWDTKKGAEGSYARVLGEAEWVQADDLVANNMLVLRPSAQNPGAISPHFIQITEYLKEEEFSWLDDATITVSNRNKNSTPLLNDIPLDKLTAFVFGLYCSDGMCGGTAVTWNLNIRETEYISAVEQWVERQGGRVTRYERPATSAIQLSVGNKLLSKLFLRMMGAKSYTFSAPAWILKTHSQELVEAYLSGLIAGDGCVSDYNGTVGFDLSVNNETLLDQSEWLFSRIKCFPAKYIKSLSGKRASFYSTTGYVYTLRGLGPEAIRASEWLIGPKGDRLRALCSEYYGSNTEPSRSRYFVQDEGKWVPVASVSRGSLNAPVYNLEVDGHNSYLVNGYAVHNCAAYKIAPEEINLSYGQIGQTSTLSEASNKDKITDSKERGLRPLLRHISGNINRHLIWPSCPDLEFEFSGLDAMTREESVDFNTKRVSTSMTLNEIRAEEDLDPLPGGDIVLNGAYLQSLQQQQQQQQMQQSNMNGSPLDNQNDAVQQPSIEDTGIESAQDAPKPMGIQDLLGMTKSQGNQKQSSKRLDIRI